MKVIMTSRDLSTYIEGEKKINVDGLFSPNEEAWNLFQQEYGMFISNEEKH